jgi:hypothetical protein
MKQFTREDIVLLTTHGTIEEARLEEADLIRGFAGKKVVLTGWDFKSKGRLTAKKYDLDAIITESCVLYLKDKDKGWEENAKPQRFELFEKSDVDLVKKINSKILEAIFKYAKYAKTNIVFRSQRNECGVCYYINNVPKKLEKMIAPEIGIATFKVHLEETFRVKAEGIEGKLRLPDTEDNRYFVEKNNGIFRTFGSYSLAFQNGHILVDLNPPKPKRDFKYEDVKGIIKEARPELAFGEYIRVAPQSDICIDIFCRPKEQTWKRGLKKLGVSKDNPVFYISKGTESDAMMILNGYIRGNFFAYGTYQIPEKLKQINVKAVGKDIKEVVEKVLYLIEERYPQR